MKISNETNIIRERVYNLFPVQHLGYSKLINLMDIRASRDIPTAAVTTGFRSVLKINPDFVEKFCQSNEAFSMLILHEMMHLLLGHTRLIKRSTPVLNYAFDAIINAHLCQLFPRIEYTSFFRILYSDTNLPEALLRPPDEYDSETPRWKLTGEVGEMHKALYSNQEVTTMEVVEMMERFFARSNFFFPADKLLGNHKECKNCKENNGETENQETVAECAPELLKEIKNIIARWPRDSIRNGRDEGGAPTQNNIELLSPIRAFIRTIRRALLSLLEPKELSLSAPLMQRAQQPGLLPWRTPSDRRGIVLEQLQAAPRFFWNGTIEHTVAHPHNPPALYIDVSGSMSRLLPKIYAALLPLKNFLEPQIVLFSTEVARIPFGELRKGNVLSTYGTNIFCVTKDMIDRRVRRALIITDGYVGDIPTSHLKKLKHGRFATALSHNGFQESVAQLPGKIYFLPKI